MRSIRPLVLAVAAALGAAGLAAGFAGAASVESLLAGALQPSAAPPLLGPITESGRTGWACKPEKAAAASRASDAELPAPGASP